MRRLVFALLAACHGAGTPVDAAHVLESRLLTVVSASHDDDARTPRRNMGTSDYDIHGSGSAFVIDGGRVLTAAHCTHDRAEVELRDHAGNTVTATLERVDERIDAAILLPEKPLSSDLRIALADRSPELGAPVYVLGATAFGFPVLTHGTVAAHVGGRFGEAMGPMTLTTITAWHGMSGAPMLGADGNVVGLAVGFLDVNYVDEERRASLLGAVPIEEIADFLAGKIAPTVKAYADYARAGRSSDEIELEVRLFGERSTTHRWMDFIANVNAPELEGHVVVLRPYVLDGTTVVGQGHPCFYARTRGTGARCEMEGHVWAKHGGTYDVVLVAGSTPIAHRKLDIPG